MNLLPYSSPPDHIDTIQLDTPALTKITLNIHIPMLRRKTKSEIIRANTCFANTRGLPFDQKTALTKMPIVAKRGTDDLACIKNKIPHQGVLTFRFPTGDTNLGGI